MLSLFVRRRRAGRGRRTVGRVEWWEGDGGGKEREGRLHGLKTTGKKLETLLLATCYFSLLKCPPKTAWGKCSCPFTRRPAPPRSCVCVCAATTRQTHGRSSSIVHWTRPQRDEKSLHVSRGGVRSRAVSLGVCLSTFILQEKSAAITHAFSTTRKLCGDYVLVSGSEAGESVWAYQQRPRRQSGCWSVSVYILPEKSAAITQTFSVVRKLLNLVFVY